MFRAMTGRFVHEAATPMDRMIAAMRQHAPSIGSILRGLPPSVTHVVDKALAFQKDDRWADARAMQQAIRAAYQDCTTDTAARLIVEVSKPPPRLVMADVASDETIDVVVDAQSPQSIIVELSSGDDKRARLQLEATVPDRRRGAMAEIVSVAVLSDAGSGAKPQGESS